MCPFHPTNFNMLIMVAYPKKLEVSIASLVEYIVDPEIFQFGFKDLSDIRSLGRRTLFGNPPVIYKPRERERDHRTIQDSVT